MSRMAYSHGFMNSIHDLSRIDLNLLVAFDAVATERSVTRAARRAGVTQSAMSHTLRRLRDLLADPVLVRGAGGMVLTPRAERLHPAVRAGLTALSRALTTPEAFVPETAQRTFRLATPDLFDALAVPALIQVLRAQSPSSNLEITPTSAPDLAQRLQAGDLDLCIQAVPAFGPAVPDLAETGMVRQTLFRETFRSFVRCGHPAIAHGPPSLADYADLPQVLVSPSGRGPGPVDAVLRAHQLARRVALRVPHFATALAAIAHSDLILTASSAVQNLVDDTVSSFEPPLELPPHDVAMVWHDRWTHDVGHRWFRDRVAQVSPSAAAA